MKKQRNSMAKVLLQAASSPEGLAPMLGSLCPWGPGDLLMWMDFDRVGTERQNRAGSHELDLCQLE